MITITDSLEIAEEELEFTASRSSGPGGQHVNKASTRITLRFDLEATAALTDEQKGLVRERLPTRISKQGILSVSAQRERSQSANRRRAVDRFAELLREALEVPADRRPTRVPRGVRRRRLDDKKHRGRLKRQRGRRFPDDRVD
ncbi:MAG: alternative ribosome rescue aminoacyl-tRNA hydrolase ArfB [Thermoanaerobaculia bacterium]